MVAIAATHYSSPGVYVEESKLTLLSITSSATAVPVFLGIFQDLEGAVVEADECFEVSNWFEFTQRFGTRAPGTLQVTPVAGDTPSWTLGDVSRGNDTSFSWRCVQLYFDNGGGRCFILPLGGTNAVVSPVDVINRYPDITLLCVALAYDAAKQQYNRLSGLQTGLGGCFLLADSPDGDEKPTTLAQRTAVYYPGLLTTYSSRPSDAELMVTVGSAEAKPLAELQSSQEALYAQISEALDGYARNHPIKLPASPAVAGALCRIDANRGPWQAPAGVVLRAVSNVDTPVSPAVENKLLEKRINAVKFFAGEGVRIWGARTMVMPSTPLWLHIQVVRLFDIAARDMKRSLQNAVFLPNNAFTWAAVRSALEAYLYKIWRDGGLKGSTAEEAYYVQLGQGVTMTDEDIAEGRLIVHVGMAALRPAEFIEVVFSQLLNGV